MISCSFAICRIGSRPRSATCPSRPSSDSLESHQISNHVSCALRLRPFARRHYETLFFACKAKGFHHPRANTKQENFAARCQSESRKAALPVNPEPQASRCKGIQGTFLACDGGCADYRWRLSDG